MEAKSKDESTKARALLKPYTKKNNSKALGIFMGNMILYLAVLYLIIHGQATYVNVILSIVLGLLAGLMFIVGHDCSHNSFTSSKKWNHILGTVAFLPTLHNKSLWDLGHNRTHHVYTSFRHKDYVYAPMTVEEYVKLSATRRFIYRIYRSSWGHGLYYAVEIWFSKMLVPHRKIPGLSMSIQKESQIGVIPLAVYLVSMITLSIVSAQYTGVSVFNLLLYTLLLPWIAWTWLMGFVIYHHHTNTNARWYDNLEEWSYWEVQLEHSYHIKFPKWINLLLHNIMEHTAHHAEAKIPMYHLYNAQQKLEINIASSMVIIPWSFRFYRNAIKKCKLYDYSNHKWVPFPNM